MKKLLILIMLSIMLPAAICAQSSMTDDQVMQMVVKEHNQGTSNAQIVTKLMQSGVNITQIQRVRKKYERQAKQSGLGNLADKAQPDAQNRMRKNNGKTKEDYQKSQAMTRKRNATTTDRMQDLPQWQPEYDENSDDFITMQGELEGILPTDTAMLVKQLQQKLEKNRRKVFGRDIFNNRDLTFEPSMNIATPQNYRLGPGDDVIIDIYGASQKSINTTVTPDGDIVIEGYGPIQVSGLSVAQATARIRSQLGSRYQSSRIKTSLGQTRTITVNVMGEVKTPGTFTLSAFATVFQALYMAGGTNDLGTLRNIKIYRHDRLISVCDIYDYILNGKMTGNVRLADGDVIIVNPYDCLVNIGGKVKRPMFYEMKKNESVGSLLKYAGGFTGDAYTKSVRVNRKTGREYAVFNVEEFDMSSFRIADGDSVSVDSILPRFENTVEVKGAVFRPGKYQLGDQINSVRTLIDHAEGLTEQAFRNRGVIHRMKNDRTLEVVSVNVGGIMEGTVADVPLKENDVLFIPSRQEAMVDRTITIHGEVQYPGIYKYADNETLEDFVLQAGGLKETASSVKVDVARRVSDPKALSEDSVIAKTFSFALKDGFVVDGEPGFILRPFDEVYVRRSPGYSAQQNISIEGQAMFPGVYTLSKKNERLSDVIKKCGGVTDQAFIEGARLVRRTNDEERARIETLERMLKSQSGGGEKGVQKDSLNAALLQLSSTYPVGIELNEALANPGGDADIVLREGDRIIIPGYNGTVKISGDVMYPNTVAYEKGRATSYYIDQAGGWGNRAKKSKTFIIYANGTVAKVGHRAKIRPGCEIVVPSKPKRSGTLAETLAVGSSVASIAAMIATIINVVK